MSKKISKDLSDAMKKATDLQNKTGEIYLVGQDKKGSYFVQKFKDGSRYYKKGGRIF